jgi:anti-anti-sigma factor
MTASAEETESTLTISISGTLNAHSQKDFRDAYSEKLAGKKEVILNMKAVDMADSTGIGMLLILHGSTKSISPAPAMKISNCSPGLKNIFKLSHIDNFFEIL